MNLENVMSVYFYLLLLEEVGYIGRNLGIFDILFHATQTWVQTMNIVVHTQMYKPELCSGVGSAESWDSPSLAWAWT